MDLRSVSLGNGKNVVRMELVHSSCRLLSQITHYIGTHAFCYEKHAEVKHDTFEKTCPLIC